MPLNAVETILTVIAITLGAMATRFVPFFVFPEHKQPPEVISYLGRVLPPAMMGLLVVYCLKGVSISINPYGLPELIAIGVIVLLHIWRKNVLLSIAGGTIVYMLLIQHVFQV